MEPDKEAIAIAYAERKHQLAKLIDEKSSFKALRERNVKGIRAQLMAEITAEKNGDGKPKYSNAEARAAELATRELVAIGDQLDQIVSLDRVITETLIEHEYTSDMLKIALAFAGN